MVLSHGCLFSVTVGATSSAQPDKMELELATGKVPDRLESNCDVYDD